jgi:hypothetical protein
MLDGTLTTGNILDIFTEEVQTRQGRVTDTFHDRGRLFVRSLLPHVADARPMDSMQGGLALRATSEELWLHPYLFRHVCRNGAIMAHTIESLHVECLGAYSLEEGSAMLRQAIADGSADNVFATSIHRIRSSATIEVDDLLNLIPHLSYFQDAGMGRFLAEILVRFSGGRDRTHFGFMNAVTSVARETEDPDERWRLEEWGGAVGARLLPRRPSNAPARAAMKREFVPAR